MMKNTASADAPVVRTSPYAPRWISNISRILDGLFEGDRSAKSDHTTRRIMLTCLRTLAKGNALSEKQQEALLESIRIRLGRPDFHHDGPVRLTRSQIPAARALLAKQKDAVSESSIEAAMKQDLDQQVAALAAKVAVLERVLDEMLSLFGGNPATNQLSSRSIPAETGLKAADAAGLVELTERNGTERSHESGMICPPGGFAAMNSMSSPANDMSQSTADMKKHVHEQKSWKPRSDRVSVSYFRNDPDRAPSANLELGGVTYSLVFQSADAAEARMTGSFSSEWMAEFEQAAGSELRRESRAHASSDRRYVISLLHGEKDRFGMKEPVLPNALALLRWHPDGRPQSVVIISGYETSEVPLRPVSRTKPKGPTHKGSVMLAA